MPKLTKAIIEALRPDGREAWAWCSAMPGLGARAQVSGRKTYVLRYRTADGTQRKLTLGRCTYLSPDQARDLARRHLAAVAAGEDPQRQRHAARHAPTVADLRDRYMREHAEPFKKPASIYQDRRNWRLHIIPAIGSMKVEDVTRTDVVGIHAKLSYSPATANLTLALLSKAFNLAIEWGWRDAANPCARVKRYAIQQREVVLTPSQLAAMDAAARRLAAAGDILPQHADLFRLMALTGCRISEVMLARRSWVDAGRRLLLLPDSKVGQRRIALPAAALRIIAAQQPSEWLIPSPLGGPMRSPYRAWARIAAEARLPPGTRPHDLRHTAGSLGHAAGLSQRQIADMLGHSSMATTERYLHGVTSERARAAEAVAAVVASQWEN